MTDRSGDMPAEREPDFTTSVSRVAGGEVNIRGYAIGDIIRHGSFAEAIYLTIRGRRPSDGELRLFEAILCSCLDHGLVNTLAVTARYVASGSAQLPAAVAAGLLCFGGYTGTPHLTADMLARLAIRGEPDDDAIDEDIRGYRSRREPVPGLGHPIHKVRDPRADAVRSVAEETGLLGPSALLLDRVRDRCVQIVGRNLLVNVDGLLGALLLDMGFAPDEILAVNMISAMPGVAAHAVEEKRDGKRLRYPADHERGYQLPEETLFWEP